MSTATETMKATATVSLEIATEERPFTYVDRFELVRGVEVWKSITTKLQDEVTLDREPVPTGHPVTCCVEKAILWAPGEESFYLFGPCYRSLTSPAHVVKPGGWYRAIVGGPAPNGSRYQPGWGSGTKARPVNRAGAFYHLAEEWKWGDVCKAFGPATDIPLDEKHVNDIHMGAGEVALIDYEALNTRDRSRHLSRVAEHKLIGEWFTAEDVMAPLAEDVFREGVSEFFLQGVAFADLCDRWKRLRPEVG